MPVYECSLWKYLTTRDSTKFGLVGRLELAVKLAKEVQSLRGQVVHRDLKPSNVMLDRGETVLVDFGIGEDSFTMGSSGTSGFNAPENFACGVQHFYSDVFSLGKVLVLVLFEWRVGWQLLWNPRIWSESETNTKFGKLETIRKLIVKMMEVWAHIYIFKL